jgi:hypothetical protein
VRERIHERSAPDIFAVCRPKWLRAGTQRGGATEKIGELADCPRLPRLQSSRLQFGLWCANDQHPMRLRADTHLNVVGGHDDLGSCYLPVHQSADQMNRIERSQCGWHG